MNAVQIRSIRLCLLILPLCLTGPNVVLSDVEDLLTQINKKPAEERQRLLVENAKKEGALTFYAATNFRDTQEIVIGFSKQYPFIKVAFSSLGGPGVLNKVLTEHRAGVYHADVVALTGGYVPELIDKGVLAKYKSPMVPYLRKGFVDADGLWPGIYAIGYTIIYNTQRVSPREVPKRFEDLLRPRWKGNMIMDAEAHDLFAGLIDLWGQEKAVNFFKRLAGEQKVQVSRQSHTFMTQLVAAGEHDLIVDGYMHNAVAIKKIGAPIEYVVTNPTILRPPSIIGITSRSPHPHSAALFLDYHLSQEASEIMVKNQGRWAPRRDVKWTIEPEAELHVVSVLEWGKKNRQLVTLFNKLVGQ